MVNDRGGADGAVFTSSLDSLKERGCSLLVVGSGVEAGQADLCELLLGEPTERRRRLLVRTDGECGDVPTGEGTPTVVVAGQTLTRDVRSRTSAADVPVHSVEDDDLDGLEETVVDGVDELVGDGADPEPSELRFCLDSLLPLLADYDTPRVRRTVASLAGHVREYDGMSHFHLPIPRDHEYVSELQTVVDAVVETRVRNGRTEQRWHVLDGAVDSGWLSL